MKQQQHGACPFDVLLHVRESTIRLDQGSSFWEDPETPASSRISSQRSQDMRSSISNKRPRRLAGKPSDNPNRLPRRSRRSQIALKSRLAGISIGMTGRPLPDPPHPDAFGIVRSRRGETDGRRSDAREKIQDRRGRRNAKRKGRFGGRFDASR